MLKKKIKLLLILSLAIVILIPTQVSLVSSSTGFIRINRTTASLPNQQVQAGGNVNLYFGDQGIMWAGTQFYLLLSHDLSTMVSSGDYIYSPRFSIENLIKTTPTDYSNGDGFWTIGSNWINGSFASNMPAGSYSVKAFDEVSDTVAVTDTYINVNPVNYSASLVISPTFGPGGINAQFTGSNYPASTIIDVAYYDQAYGIWMFWRTVTTDSVGRFSFNAEIPDLGKSVYQGDCPETYNRLQYKTVSHTSDLVYNYVTYDQYARGIKSIGGKTANGLFGNSSNLASTVKVKAGDTITITGKWFQPGVIYIRLDGETGVGTSTGSTVTSNQWNSAIIIGQSVASSTGSFEATATIPNSIDAGEHFIAVEDPESKIIVKILITAGTLQLTPASGPGGANLQFTGAGYPASTPVTISYRDNLYGTWNYWTTVNSSSAGNINLNAEIPDLKKSAYSGDSYNTSTVVSFRTEVNGKVYAFADYTQYARGLKQVGTQISTYGLYGNNTNFSNYNLKVKPGDTITISGRYFHPGVIYIRWDGAAVVGTVTADEWSRTSPIGTTIANSAGSFDTTVTIPTSDAGEHWVAIEDSQTKLIIKIQITSPPAPSPSPTVSPSQPTPTPAPTQTPTPTPTPSPNKPTPTIDVSCQSTSTANGFRVEINGILSGNGTWLANKAVQLYYSNDGGKSWVSLTLVNTGNDGKFNAVWMSPVSGIFLVKAVCEGNTEYNQASTTVNFAVTPAPEQNVFSITSNSTITQLAFNSETKELSFNATGPSGTKGYFSINIPKTLINDISGLKVYLDGSEVTFSSEQQTDLWIITFSYSHSTHTIVMDLSNTSNPNNTPAQLPIYVIAIVAIAIIAVAAVAVLKKKHKNNDKTNSTAI